MECSYAGVVVVVVVTRLTQPCNLLKLASGVLVTGIFLLCI